MKSILSLFLILKIKFNRLANLLYDHYCDFKYGVKTCRKDSLNENRKLYFDYEPAGYIILNKLFQKYKFSVGDHLVDFGCGKGRVLILAAAKSCPKITGVEINQKMFNIAVQNVQSYQKKFTDSRALIDIENIDALTFKINKDMNVFYFFNPFHLKIFIYILKAIKQSIQQYPRKVQLLLIGPRKSTINYIENMNCFHLVEESSLPIYITKRDIDIPRFSVYTNDSIIPDESYTSERTQQ